METLKKGDDPPKETSKLLIFHGTESAVRNFSVSPYLEFAHFVTL
jgi:hypothetical protein